MTLIDLNEGGIALITKVLGRGAFRKRITEMGFIPGKEIRVVKKAPLKDPIEYNIMGYHVSLRNSEAAQIEVITLEEALLESKMRPDVTHPDTFDEFMQNKLLEKGKSILVALVGNPNCGKTTLFNYASNSRERVGNYSGVTVDAKEARFRISGHNIKIIDLPGTYSLSAYSPEELYVREYITSKHPDIVVNVLDASNLERNLYLTTQLIDMDVKVVIALNMFDDLQRSGNKLDHSSLGSLLGIPVLPTIGSKGKGIRELLNKIIEVYEDKDETVRHIHIHYGLNLEKSIQEVQGKIKIADNYFLTDKISSRFLSIKLLEKDNEARIKINQCGNAREIIQTAEREIKRLEDDLGDDSESLFTDAKYGFIGGALRETFTHKPETKIRRSELIDTFLTHRFWGIPVFLFFMWLSFYTTFKIGAIPKDWIQSSVDALSLLFSRYMNEGMLKDLLVQGIIGGVGGVIIFLPNILLLFLFISIMEDSGYLARAVFIMDKVMHRIGLHGKSFIPLLMGFGCNVPAIMSTRIIESRRDRLITMLINPFMSCSARLPVYILLITAFFDNYQGTILFFIYAVGILLAVFSSLLFNKTIFRKTEVPFVMELPPYRVPTLRSLLKHMWYRVEQYLRKIAGVILVASIIIWALGYFPRNETLHQKYRSESARVSDDYDKMIAGLAPADANRIMLLQKEKLQAMNRVLMDGQRLLQEQSFIGQIGHFLEPVMQPLGFDWKMSVAILTGIAGKEIVVGTMGVLYQAGPDDGSRTTNLISKIRNARLDTGQLAFNKVVALSFIFFILIYFPCIAVISAVKKESGHWKWAAFLIFYTTGLAWLVSFLTYQLGTYLT